MYGAEARASCVDSITPRLLRNNLEWAATFIRNLINVYPKVQFVTLSDCIT